MRSFFVALALLTAFVSGKVADFKERIEKDGSVLPDGGRIWVVLVAGSEGFFNYRHQADMCHAYQVRLYEYVYGRIMYLKTHSFFSIDFQLFA